MGINVLDISGVGWTNRGRIQHLSYSVIYYSGNNLPAHPNGVPIISSKETDKSVVTFIPHSDRMMLLKKSAQPIKNNIIKVSSSTTEKSDIEISDSYSEFRELQHCTKKNENNLIIADFNSKVAEAEVEGVGKYGLGQANSRGDTGK